VWGVVLLHRRKSKPGTLTALVRLARASSAAAVTAVAVPDSSPQRLPQPVVVVGWRQMKPALIALLALGMCLPVAGAEKKKPGTVLWEFKTGGRVISSPAIGSDGTVYVGSMDKKLYAINGKSGVKLWEFKTGDGVFSGVDSSPAIGSDGTVYVGSIDHKLYAIKTDSKGLAKSPWPMRGQNARHTGRAK